MQHRKHPLRTKLASAAIIGLSALGIAAAATTAANASPSTVIATTQVSNHPDTTSGGTGTACVSSPGGPVWAKDTYASQMTAVNTGTDTWRVTLQDTGSFAGFADPATCNALVSKGSLLGLYTVTVTSAKLPSAANLAASYSGDVSSTTMVQDFFGDPTAVVAGGDYFFSYQDGAYVQTTSSLYGDVAAYVPPTTVKIPNVIGWHLRSAMARLRSAGFKPVVVGTVRPHTGYNVTRTSPTGSAPAGSVIKVFIKRR